MNMPKSFSPQKDAVLNGRRIEFFHHSALPEWGGSEQVDSFAVLHPTGRKRKTGLYVVLHSAGHGLFSVLGCSPFHNNHDIYRTPDDLFGLYLDCREHRDTDFWWGGINALGEGGSNRKDNIQPVEKRLYATIEWVKTHYPIDPERIYISGHSMGGSGALGIGMCRGDLFAAVKGNVAAGVEHMLDRCFKAGTQISDPPVCIDYSAQNDKWSNGHEKLYRSMREHKFALYGYWADFGHANDDATMLEKNDLIHSFDWLSIRRNRAYPVFTNADSDDSNPWEAGRRSSSDSGQVNAFFRWKNVADHPQYFRMRLFLVSPETLKTSFTIPAKATADVSLRRLQQFRIRPNEPVRWSFGVQSGIAEADVSGLLTLPRLEITQQETVLKLSRTRK